MTQISVSSFLDVVERSGLVERSRLENLLSDLERDAPGAVDSQVVSSRLTEAGLLTPWQSERLLQGRAKGFFVGKYKLLDHLGTGGMSAVYLAEHVVMRRRVAVKVLPQSRVHDSSYLARFHREARAVAALDHPNIVRAFDVDNDEDDVHYLVMEYVDGQDLKQTVEASGPLEFATAAEIIRQAAEGLAHAHQAGLIHRDMKPANLLIDKKGTVKVLDLGLARFADETEASLTNEHDEKMLGTVDYLAPEQAVNSHEVDSTADIYSLGCTLYFALTGLPPFPTGSLAQRVFMHQTQDAPSVYQRRPDAPAELVSICRRMMSKSPSARYQSAAEVSRVLEHWIGMYRERLSRQQSGRRYAEEELTLAPLEEESRPAAAAPASVPPAPAVTSGPAGAPKSPSDAPPGKRLPRASSAGSAEGRAVEGRAAAARPVRPAPKPAGAAPAEREAGPARPREAALPPAPAPLEELLADIPPVTLSGPSPIVAPSGSGRLRAPAGGGPQNKSRWDSPWFLMGVGTVLALAAIVLWFVYAALTG